MARVGLSSIIISVASLAPFNPGIAASAGISPAQIAQETAPSIVEIEVLRSGEAIAAGSGFIIDPSGLIVTNYHVIEKGSELVIRIESGEEFHRVFVVNHSERFDLAILRISAMELPAVRLGASSDLSVGDEVFVFSNPMGFARSFSQGIMSARRVVDGIEILQVSAPISSGSSGGAVLDSGGNVIGVATATISEGQNLNIAIPIKYVKGLLQEESQPQEYSEFAQQNWPVQEPEPADNVPLYPISPWVAGVLEDVGLNQDVFLDVLQQAPEFEQEMIVQLAIVRAAQFEDTGFEEFEWGETVALERRDTHAEKARFPSGTYAVVAACDRDCSELFIGVKGESEWLAFSETETDLPIAEFTIRSTQDIEIFLTMERCQQEPCFAKLALIHR